MQKRVGFVALAVYGLSVYLANWLIHNVGMPVPGGNHLIPVGLGLLAPSGTVMAGVTLVARDVLQRTIGRKWSVLVIVPGTLLTALLSPQLAVASGAAFLLGELFDYAVYTPLQAQRFVLAVFASGIVGSVVDSILFLHLAGIPLSLALPGTVLGKFWVMVVAIPAARYLRTRIPAPAVAVA
jgi:hypothetical protein